MFLYMFFLILVSYGFWYDYVKVWWEKSKNLRVLFMFYEDMKEVRNGRYNECFSNF